MKRIAAIMIASLFVLTAFAVVEMPMAKASTPTQNFSFPYSYGQPQVPSDVGAQGIQGPTVPNSSIGDQIPVNERGATGHIGPMNINTNGYFPVTYSTVTITVRNGTTSSYVAAAGQQVAIRNLTTLSYIVGKTTPSTGVVTFNVPEGWWQIDVNASSTSFVSFFGSVNIKSTAVSYMVYLIPQTNSVVNVNNPSSSTGTIWYISGEDLGLYSTVGLPQIPVELLNESASGAVLATAYEQSNGSVEFTSVNTAYSYALFTLGYGPNALTNWNYYLSNSTSSTFTVSGVTSLISTSNFKNSGGAGPVSPAWNNAGAVISGTTFPSKFSQYWDLTTDTIISGGIVYLGNVVSNGYTLFMENTTVYLNSSYNFTYEISNSSLFGISPAIHVLASDSRYIFSWSGPSNHNWIVMWSSIPSLSSKIVNSYITIITQSPAELSSFTQYTPETYNNDIFINTQMVLVPMNLTNDTIINSTIGETYPVSASFTPEILTQYNLMVYNTSQIIAQWATMAHRVKIINNTYYGSASSSTGYSSIVFDADTSINISTTTFNYYLPSFNIARSINININRSLFNVTLGTGSQDFNAVNDRTNITNSIFNNPSRPLSYLVLHNTNVQYYPRLQITGNLTFSFNYVNWASSENGNSSAFIYGYDTDLNVTVKNNYFTGLYIDGGFIEGNIGNMNISNNTFGASYINSSYSNYFQPAYGEPNGMSLVYTYNPGSARINNNNFFTVLGGKGAPYDIGQVSHGKREMNISSNVFYAKDMLQGSSRFAQPFAAYMLMSFGTWNLNDNYFLNLNNYTEPFVIPTDFYNGGFGPVNLSMNNNHFFVAPYANDSVVLVNPYSTGNISYVNYVNSIYTGSFSGFTYTSNSGPLLYNGGNVQQSVIESYGGDVFVYTPDTYISNNQMTISYSNGLVGGPQPNFTWQGYKYTESVEPSYIQVGVNSANAPPVNLQFNGAPNTAYSVAMYDNGQLIDYTNVTSNANGVVTFTYNPATMPLDPVFELTTISASMPPPTPVSNTFLYLEIGLIAVLSVGLVIPLIVRRQYR